MLREHAERDNRPGLHGGSPGRTSAAGAPAHAGHSRRKIDAAVRCQTCEADAATLTRLSDAVEDLQEMVGLLVARGDQRDTQAGQTPGSSRPRSHDRGARNITAIPSPGETVPWDAHFRADVPPYVMEQLKAEAYRTGRTAISVLLKVMSAFRDGDGCSVFRIREEDMIADRRKGARATRRTPLRGGSER